MYVLIVIGYMMVYGVLWLINFVYVDVMMVGVFSMLFLFFLVGLFFGVVVFLIFGLCGLFGMLIDWVVYCLLCQVLKIFMLIIVIGVSFFFENLFNVLFGGSLCFFFVFDFFNQIWVFGSVIIINVVWIVLLIIVLLLLVIFWLLYCICYGMVICVVVFDVNIVCLMGIDVNWIIFLVFVFGSSFVVFGGVFYFISYLMIDFLMGVFIGLKVFVVVVLGGIGSVIGVVLGGFIFGFIEVVVVVIFFELGGYKDVFVFLFLILVFLFCLVGIMGDECLERSCF